jgi:3D (Asp-Asp-Asp) domain-containing protein
MTALLGAALLLVQGWCIDDAKITAYVRTEYGPRTYDGTSIYADEPIAAASWNIPIDSMVWIDGYGTVRIADRGALGSRGWVDIAVWSRSEAFALTSTRRICVFPPG